MKASIFFYPNRLKAVLGSNSSLSIPLMDVCLWAAMTLAFTINSLSRLSVIFCFMLFQLLSGKIDHFFTCNTHGACSQRLYLS